MGRLVPLPLLGQWNGAGLKGQCEGLADPTPDEVWWCLEEGASLLQCSWEVDVVEARQCSAQAVVCPLCVAVAVAVRLFGPRRVVVWLRVTTGAGEPSVGTSSFLGDGVVGVFGVV